MAISIFFESTDGAGRISFQKSDHAPDDYNLTHFKSADAKASQKRIDFFDSSYRCKKDLPYRRGGDTRGFRSSSRHSRWRICFHCRTVRLRQNYVALDPGTA